LGSVRYLPATDATSAIHGLVFAKAFARIHARRFVDGSRSVRYLPATDATSAILGLVSTKAAPIGGVRTDLFGRLRIARFCFENDL
jgi:hypothetical protein